MSITPRDVVKQIGFQLGVGDTTYPELCPFCEGGDHHDKRTCSITRDSLGLVLYRCFRVKCGERGRINGDGSGFSTGTPVGFRPNPYVKKVKELNLEDFSVLNDLWHLDIGELYKAKWYIAFEEKGWLPLLIPVHSPNGGLRGHVLRIQHEDGKKEIKSKKIADENWMDWSVKASNDIVVVEDQISKQRASEFCSAVAVLGTEITPDKFAEILKVAGPKKRIWLALDRDAVKKGFEYLKRYRIYCDNIFLLMLKKDIKNMTDSELFELGGPFSEALAR